MAWLPLDVEIDNRPLATARQQVTAVAVKARELSSLAARYNPAEDATEGKPSGLAEVASAGRDLYAEINRLDAALRASTIDSDSEQWSTHVLNRLADTRQLIARTTSWVRKVEELNHDRYHRMAAIGSTSACC